MGEHHTGDFEVQMGRVAEGREDHTGCFEARIQVFVVPAEEMARNSYTQKP